MLLYDVHHLKMTTAFMALIITISYRKCNYFIAQYKKRENLTWYRWLCLNHKRKGYILLNIEKGNTLLFLLLVLTSFHFFSLTDDHMYAYLVSIFEIHIHPTVAP
jgi:hypothetical protein